jgi:hypothetical protein
MIKKLASICSKIKGFSKKFREIVIKVPEDHFLVVLTGILEWEELIRVAKARRTQVLKMPHVGRRPHLREMLGVLILRAIKSCTLQEAMDLARHYAPARILCGFIDDKGVDSGMGPDFRTISDFEILMGQEGLREINAIVLRAAAKLGFADIKGLCADTTAQEAAIPYPTEVGLMRSFARSVINGITALKSIPGALKEQVLEFGEKINKEVRKYRLFAKDLGEKQKIGANILKIVSNLQTTAAKILEQVQSGKVKVKAQNRRFINRLPNLLEIFSKLKPQIEHFLKNGRPCKNKIISLDQPEARSIPRGKDGKDCEFGFKWIVNRIRNGYIWLTVNAELGNVNEFDCAVNAVKEHIALFGTPPEEYGYDRGGWSEDHIEEIKKLGVKRIAIAPKGQAKWKVSDRCKEQMVRERAQCEGSIGCLKRVGLNRPYAKNTQSSLRAGQRAALRLNLTKIVRDINDASNAAA